MSLIVIDSSSILSFIMPDETTPANVLKVMRDYKKHMISFLAPSLLIFEVANAVKSAVLQRRTTEKNAFEIISEFKNLAITYENPSMESVLETAIEHKITCYDAAYLTLSETKDIPLLTLDKKLIELIKKYVDYKKSIKKARKEVKNKETFSSEQVFGKL